MSRLILYFTPPSVSKHSTTDTTCLPVEEHSRFEISKMQSRHRLVEQIGQRSQRHDHKCRSSNNVERCCSSRTPTCSVQSLNHCIEDTSSHTESNRRP